MLLQRNEKTIRKTKTRTQPKVKPSNLNNPKRTTHCLTTSTMISTTGSSMTTKSLKMTALEPNSVKVLSTLSSTRASNPVLSSVCKQLLLVSAPDLMESHYHNLVRARRPKQSTNCSSDVRRKSKNAWSNALKF